MNYIKESWKLENKDKLLKLEKYLKENDEKIRRLKSSLKINGEKITISGLNLDAVLKKGKNGRIIATVSDNLNLLNKRENQLIIEQYRKAGIDIKNNLLSEIIAENNRQAMKQSSANYDEEFIDGKEVESRGKFYTGTSIISGQVVYATSAYRSENLKNSKISSSENTDEDSAFKGGYRKKPINEELHEKINERGKGHYYILQQKKKGEYVRVGRWMSKNEYKKMLKTGKIQLADGNMTHVSNPADIEAFKAAPKGSVYVEFDISKNSIRSGGNKRWGIIHGPNSIIDRKLKLKGLPGIKEIPDVYNIEKKGEN